MARLRVGDIGSISDWLPSRRSVESHRGALVIALVGHVRSGRSTGLNGAYLWHGMPLGCCWTGATEGCVRFCCIVAASLRFAVFLRRPADMPATRDEGASLLQAPAAAAKEEQRERHNNCEAYQPERTRGFAPPPRDAHAGAAARGAALRGRRRGGGHRPWVLERSVLAGVLLGQQDHADGLGLGHAEAGRELACGGLGMTQA